MTFSSDSRDRAFRRSVMDGELEDWRGVSEWREETLYAGELTHRLNAPHLRAVLRARPAFLALVGPTRLLGLPGTRTVMPVTLRLQVADATPRRKGGKSA